MSEAETITKQSRSNLAFAFLGMTERVRRRMAQFYAFCRVVDDIVDEPGMTDAERHAALDRWEQIVQGTAESPYDELEQDVRMLIEEMALDRTPMLKLISGCRRDIAHVQPLTRDEMLMYTYCVASCVGLTSARIMGASSAADTYAIALGNALQMVNIIRDVGEDIEEHGRVYLPVEDMEVAGYNMEQLRARKETPELKFLLAKEAELADSFFKQAEDAYQLLSPEDRAALVPAQGMGLIYGTILEKMKEDNFCVFQKRYRVNNFHKLWLLLKASLSD